ncbi:MAG: HesA/MoeB/ThiF family protein [Anaerolineae bacterium]|nr:HesA/MoeB/ThiF family protein [Anaerolineae bacterium]
MKLPSIKKVHAPLKFKNNSIRIGTVHYGVGSEIQDDDGAIWQLLELMDGSRTHDQIIANFLQNNPDWDRDSIHQSIDTLIEGGFVEDGAIPIPENLTSAELNRYNRSADYFAWIDTQPRTSPFEIQSRLKNSRVTVLGLGGIGSAVTMGLAAAGVGSIYCVDFDIVEESNLNRQLLYTEEDIGLPKVEQAVKRLKQLNSHIAIDGENLKVDSSESLHEIMSKGDLFILCADRPIHHIQRWTNDAAISNQIPWMMCLYAGPMAVVGTFIPGKTPCYRCFAQNENIKKEEPTHWLYDPYQFPNAVIAPTAAISGHFACMEAIYYLGDLKPQTIGRIFHQNLMIYEHNYYVEAPFWQDCPACGSPAAPDKEKDG